MLGFVFPVRRAKVASNVARSQYYCFSGYADIGISAAICDSRDLLVLHGLGYSGNDAVRVKFVCQQDSKNCIIFFCSFPLFAETMDVEKVPRTGKAIKIHEHYD